MEIVHFEILQADSPTHKLLASDVEEKMVQICQVIVSRFSSKPQEQSNRMQTLEPGLTN
jgi:hypothetical protein